MYYKDEGQWFDGYLNPVDPCEDLRQREPAAVDVLLLSTYDAAPFRSDDPALRGTLAAAPNGSVLVLQTQTSLA